MTELFQMALLGYGLLCVAAVFVELIGLLITDREEFLGAIIFTWVLGTLGGALFFASWVFIVKFL